LIPPTQLSINWLLRTPEWSWICVCADWKPKETSLLHPIASSVPFVQDVGERESVALTGCLPCGYMVTGGMPVWRPTRWPSELLCSHSTRGKIPGSSLGTRLGPFWAAEGCQHIWRRVLLKQIPLLTLRLDSPPPEFPDVPLRYCPALSPHRQGEAGNSEESSPAVLSFCKCPQ